ncbi:hypothetical protein P5673_005882 [Acropora cervicornis]|uniref:Uncharacterized protein n=1 Tax=Acropora cervicornis TaxID=6130 RepID=A0AAD9QX52_ACRCE|nr:hypothetical protein P5673_005882 [Acropora cervicornis]
MEEFKNEPCKTFGAVVRQFSSGSGTDLSLSLLTVSLALSVVATFVLFSDSKYDLRFGIRKPESVGRDSDSLEGIPEKSDWRGRHLRQNHAKRRRFQRVKSYSWVPLGSETAPLPLKKTTKKNALSQRNDLSNANFPINEREQSFRGVLAHFLFVELDRFWPGPLPRLVPRLLPRPDETLVEATVRAVRGVPAGLGKDQRPFMKMSTTKNRFHEFEDITHPVSNVVRNLKSHPPQRHEGLWVYRPFWNFGSSLALALAKCS